MTSNATVRTARPTDVSKLLALRSALWPGLTTEQHRRDIARCFGNAGSPGASTSSVIFVAEVPDTAGTEKVLAGFVELLPGSGLTLALSASAQVSQTSTLASRNSTQKPTVPSSASTSPRDPRPPTFGDVAGTTAEVAGLFVAPEFRNLGVARALVVAATRWCAAANCMYLSLSYGAGQHTELGEIVGKLGFGTGHHRVHYNLLVPAENYTGSPSSSLAPDHPSSVAEAGAAGSGLSTVAQGGMHVPARARSRRAPRARAIGGAEATPPTLRWGMHAVLILLGLLALAFTNIYSDDLLRGAILPIVDVVFVVYLVGLFLVWRYRRNVATSNIEDRVLTDLGGGAELRSGKHPVSAERSERSDV